MKLPEGIIKSRELDTFLQENIDYHIKIFYDKIALYEPISLFHNWRMLIRCIDELINIPIEAKFDDEINVFLNSHIDFDDLDVSIKSVMSSRIFLEKRFNKEIAERYLKFSIMLSSINKAFHNHNYYLNYDNTFNLNNIENSIDFLQSRRIYFVTTLFLIPKIAKGTKKCEFIDLLNVFLQILDTCLINVTSSFYKLIINNSILNFQLEFDERRGISNFNFNQLESFYLNPQRLSLLDQIEFHKDEINFENLIGKDSKKLFSFNEIADTMTLLSSAFKKYDLNETIKFKELNYLFQNIALYLYDDYDIIIDECHFDEIKKNIKNLSIYIDSTDYFINLNSIAPFQKSENIYYSTVVLLNKFAYNLILNELSSNKRFQINSGFIFEKKISILLDSHGFIDTKITRINRKEFDVVTIKDEKIFNFQCKNNYYNISDIGNNYGLLVNLNRRLCKYYEKALKKEENRENLLTQTLEISNIEHFVISRFPVITENKNIINFNNLEDWLKIFD